MRAESEVSERATGPLPRFYEDLGGVRTGPAFFSRWAQRQRECGTRHRPSMAPLLPPGRRKFPRTVLWRCLHCGRLEQRDAAEEGLKFECELRATRPANPRRAWDLMRGVL